MLVAGRAVSHHPARRRPARDILFWRRSFHLPRIDEANLGDTDVRILAWCLISNHVHLIALPGRSDSLRILMRRVHGRYAQYYNAHTGRTGHLWQNRFYGRMLAPNHLWTAIAYVERNPVRARIARHAEDYLWSGAIAHVTGGDASGLLDMEWWRNTNRRDWRKVLRRRPTDTDDEASQHDSIVNLRACTYAERPFGDEKFVEEMAARFGRHWNRGRPTRWATLTPHERAAQFRLFGSSGSSSS